MLDASQSSFSRRRAVLGFADQGVSTAQNFLLVVLVGRSVPAVAFGAFAVCYTIYTLAVGVEQAALSEPLLILHSANGYSRPARDAVERALAITIGGGVVMSVALFAASLWTSGALASPLVAIAITMPALLTHDVLRFLALCRGRPAAALALDGSWVILWVIAEVIVALGPGTSSTTAWLAWGVPTYVTSVAGFAAMRVRPRGIKGVREHMSSTGSLTVPLLADFGAANATTQVVALAMGGLIGLRSLAGFRVAQSLLGPANTVAAACRIVFVPELVRTDPGSPGGRQALRRLNLMVVSVIAAYAAIAVLLPGAVGRALFGASWRFCGLLVLPVAVARIAGALLVAPAAALRAHREAKVAAQARVIGGIATVVAVLPGLLLRDVEACAWGLAAGAAATACIYWRLYLESTARRATEAGPHPEPSRADVKRDRPSQSGPMHTGS